LGRISEIVHCDKKRRKKDGESPCEMLCEQKELESAATPANVCQSTTPTKHILTSVQTDKLIMMKMQINTLASFRTGSAKREMTDNDLSYSCGAP
jgi:hypothetical protein